VGLITSRIFICLLAFGWTQSSWGQAASTIREIVVRGNQRVLAEAILAQMRTKVGQPYIQENLDRDRTAIEDMGFFSAVSVRANPLEEGQFRVVVDVEEFPEIKEIRVVGNTVIPSADILAVLTLKPGEVYNLNALGPSRTAIQELYARKGYFVQVGDFTPLRDSPGTINLELIELQVGQVNVVGARTTRPSVLRRLIKTRPGDIYNQEKWGQDLRRAASTGWFEPGTIRSAQDTERELGKVDLTMEVREARTGLFNVGIQFDPRSSLAGFIRVSDNNLFGTGQAASIDFLQTTRGGGASIGLEYSNPFFDSKDTTFSASVYSRILYRFNSIFNSNTPTDEEGYRERRTGASVGLSRNLTNQLSVGASIRFEDVTTPDISESESNSFIRQDGSVTVLSLVGSRDRRDITLDPSRGDLTRLEIEPGFSRITRIGGAIEDPSILGSNSFFRTSLEYRTYFSDQPRRTERDIDAPRRVLAFRALAGSISGTVPFFEQFFAGGANTVRGYDEDRFWGTSTLLTTVEYRYPVQRAFNLIAFVDYGGAWGGYGSLDDFTQSRSFKLHLGYGIGASLRTPFGPIRFDFAFNEDGKSRTHFLIGTSF